MNLQGNAVRVLTAAHDWTMGNGSAGYLQGNAAVAQQVNCRLLQILGECFWDAGAGIAWFQWLGSNNPLGLALAIQTVIRNSINVTGLVMPTPVFTVNAATRAFTIGWTATTVFTTTPVRSSVTSVLQPAA